MAPSLLIGAHSFLGKIWQLCTPYWKSEEKWQAWGLLAAIVALTLGNVYLLVELNDWNRQFFNMLEQKAEGDFLALMQYFCFLAAVFIVVSIYRTYLQQMLEMRWRIWLSRQYLVEWMGKQVYYRLELENLGTDNPDQRIAEDMRLFTSGTLSLGLGLMRECVTLASFVAILWSVSGPITLFGVEIAGYMVWAALLYAVAGSVLTHYVGRKLIGLNFHQERLEADFRFNLVRLREHAEGVALYRGEATEQAGLLTRLNHIRENWWALMFYTKRLGAFTIGYSQVAIVFPYFVAGHRYFSGSITLGGLSQIASAFGQVQSSLSWFVDSYTQLANWRASVDRLLTFHNAVERASSETLARQADRESVAGATGIGSDALDLALPGGRVVLSKAAFELPRGARVLLTGPSGSGKSTLFRAIAGIWPFAGGRIRVPEGASVLFLPQKPYIPIGTLRDALAYPAAGGSFPDAALREVLAKVQLERFADRLDESGNWSLSMSGGEQQRLAICRALLHKPDWVFLDEATSALDEPSEQRAYTVLRDALPQSAIVSIAHRPTVAAFHEQRIRMEPEGDHMRLATA